MPAFGDADARILIVGLAPAAHGGNRTGRVFTGDASGDFLFPALHAVGLANQPEARGPEDGLALSGALISAVCRCAPPDNRPLPEEIENCREYLERELALLPRPRVLVALGKLAFDRSLLALHAGGAVLPKPRPRFAHGARVPIGEDVLFATYHPSQQNTFTGQADPEDAAERAAARGAGGLRAVILRSGRDEGSRTCTRVSRVEFGILRASPSG